MKRTNPVRSTSFIYRKLLLALTAVLWMLALPMAQASGKQAVIMQISENDGSSDLAGVVELADGTLRMTSQHVKVIVGGYGP